MTKAKQTVQDARDWFEDRLEYFAIKNYMQQRNKEAIRQALNLLADLEAGKVRVVPNLDALGLMTLHMYKAMLEAAPPHEAETYLKGLK